MVLISGIVIGIIGAGFALWLGRAVHTRLKDEWHFEVDKAARQITNHETCDKCKSYEVGSLEEAPHCKRHGFGIHKAHIQSCRIWRARDEK